MTNPVLNDENTLVEVTFLNDFEVCQAIQSVASYNRRHRNLIEVFYEPFLVRFEATIILQRWFKGLLFRRHLKPLFRQKSHGRFVLANGSLVDRSITIENTLYSHFALIQRVVRRI